MPEGYRLWVSESRKVLVRLWDEGAMHDHPNEQVCEVSIREDPSGIWGPPVILKEEK